MPRDIIRHREQFWWDYDKKVREVVITNRRKSKINKIT